MTSSNGKRAILVVDDDRVVRKLCHSVLQPEGFAVEQAENGQQALDMIIAKDYDLLLTDVEMPVMDGLTLLGRLRDIPVAPPAIIMTSHSNVPNAVQALKWGAFDFITKPFLPEAMLAAVRRCLTSTRLQKEVESLRTNRLLIPLFEAIINTPDSAKVVDVVLGMTCELLRADGGSVLIYDAAEKVLVVRAVKGAFAVPILGKKLDPAERVAGHALQARHIVTLHGSLSRNPQFSALPLHQAIESSMAAPMLIRKEPFGVLCVKRIANREHFQAADEELFDLVAHYGALAISNARAQEDLRQTKELLEHQLQQRDMALERALAELQEYKERKG